MQRILSRSFATLSLLAFALVAPASAQKDKDLKLDKVAVQVEEMKTELTLLQRQVQTMQDTLSKSSGEMSTLIAQMSDNISSIRRAQSAVSTNTAETTSQVTAMGERVASTNQRLERLSEQFARLGKLIEDLPKQPVMAQITPGNPEQLFAAAYADFSRGNYDLALSEFRQYVETYPTSELADNAQYWIGEILYAQRKFPAAVTEFEKVGVINPKGDKTAAALYKRGLVLLEMNNKDDGVTQLLAVIKNYAKTPEAGLATQQLQRVAPEALEPATSEAPPKRAAAPDNTRKRKP
jgi:tol-pal system protein YbgF